MGQRAEIQSLHKDGHTIPLEASMSKMPFEGGLVLSAQVRDVFERKNVAKPFRESEIRYRMFFEHVVKAMAPLTVTGSVMASTRQPINCLLMTLTSRRYRWDLN